MNLKRTGEDLLAKAREILKRDGRHAPMVFVYGEHDDAIVLLEFTNGEEKYRAMYAVGRRLAGMHPVAVAFVCEAWMSTTMPPKGTSVSEMADRQEVIAVAIQTRRLRIWSATMPFIHVGGEIVFGELLSGVEAESELLEEFWRGVIDGEEEAHTWSSN